MSDIGTMRVKTGLAEMLKGGVIMDVVTAEQAKVVSRVANLHQQQRMLLLVQVDQLLGAEDAAALGDVVADQALAGV